MKINRYLLGELSTNTYLISQDNECICIDPADDAPFILEEIMRKRLTLRAIVLTHGHFDHCLAVGEIQSSLHVPILLDKRDVFLVERVQSTARYYLKHIPFTMPFNMQTIQDISKKNKIQIGSFQLEVLHTPGHTPGSSSFLIMQMNALFTGDTLFKGAIGRTDFVYSSKKDMKRSFEKLFSKKDNFIIYPGHGDLTTLHEEKKIRHLFV